MEKGDRVLVWSLQSFSHGGFLNGEPAFVRQNTNGSDSVILCVIRNFDGENKIDESYEVYIKQVEMVNKGNWYAEKRLKKFRKQVMSNNSIS